MRCPKCNSESPQKPHGKTSKGNARYRCSECKKTYILEPPRYTEAFKKSAIQLYLEGNSGRSTGRYFGMSKANAVRWIKERAAKTPEPDAQTAEITIEPVEVIELDEMFHFVKKKN